MCAHDNITTIKLLSKSVNSPKMDIALGSNKHKSTKFKAI